MDYEQLIRLSYLTQIFEDPISVDLPVRIHIRAIFPLSKSDSKAVKEAKLSGCVLPTKKPDCDNIVKIVCDALNGVAYDDDKQIVECSIVKVFGETPAIEVMVGEV